MRQGPKLELVSYIDHSSSFFCFCEDVEVAIRELKTRHPIFLVEAEDHDFVLSQSFWTLLNSIKNISQMEYLVLSRMYIGIRRLFSVS